VGWSCKDNYYSCYKTKTKNKNNIPSCKLQAKNKSYLLIKKMFFVARIVELGNKDRVKMPKTYWQRENLARKREAPALWPWQPSVSRMKKNKLFA
jgi:hypothetical protein